MGILIIGGGIGGLTAAIALRHAGFEVEVYERADELREVGAGLSLWKNAIGALASIGVADALRPMSIPYVGAALRTDTGRVLVDVSGDQGAALVESAIVMHRAALQRVLADRLGTEHIRLGKECVGVETDDGGVVAKFADGTVAKGTALIGADGLHSVVRASVHGSQPPVYSGYTSWRAVVPFEHSSLAIGESWGRGTRFGQVPLAGGQVYWFAVRNAPAGEHAAHGEKPELARIFKDWHAPIPALIDRAPDASIIRVDIHDRPPLKTWGRGRVTLLGDAAHPMTPNLGQGACQAIEDAVVLARSLKETPDVSAALRAYESRRIPRTSTVVKASRNVGAIGQWANPVAVALRNTLVGALGPRMQARQMASVIDYVA